MKIVGLTGGIASGKSTVEKILIELGATVIDADQLSRDAVEKGTPALQAITMEFGSEILCSDGSLNRKALAAKVFSDIEALRRLEAIMHPAISELASRRLAEFRAKGLPIVFYMAPLLIERGLQKEMDEVWVVYVDDQTQLQRLIEREGFTEEEAKQRIAAQMPIETKKQYGRVIIDNRNGVEELREQVERAWQELMERAKG
jgi:dephospho-CoA kinase